MIIQDPCCPESGVSEIVGALMLISVVVVVVAIMGVYLSSQPPSQKIPSLQASVWNDTQTLSIKHDGGDPISYNEIKIYVNCVDQTSKFNLSTAPTQPWTTWTNGNVLQYPTHSFPLGNVMVVYKGASSDVALTTFFLGDAASACGTGVFVPPPLPVTSSFTGTPTSGAVSLTVAFTDTSANSPTSWSWNFGDTGTSSLQNPSHQYTSTGTYTVTLTATNAGGSDTATITNYITVRSATHTITASSTSSPGWGTISPSGAVIVADGASQTFTITAGSKNILSVVVDGVPQTVTNPTTTYTFTNVIADHTIVVTFG